MTPSRACIDLVRTSEGCRLTTYLCPAGFPTIGYGHRLVSGQSYPQGITEEQAEALLEIDLNVACTQMLAVVDVPLTQGQCDALTDFVFNLGIGRLESSTLLKELNLGHYDAVPGELAKWTHAGGIVLPGLATRRNKEIALWESK